MVVYEKIDGGDMIRAYSDRGMKIINPEGQVYDEAIDPEYTYRRYAETNEPVDSPDEEQTEPEILIQNGSVTV